MVVVAGGDVAQAVDLRGDVVVDEQGVAVPARVARVALWHRRSTSFWAAYAAGRAERNDLARRVARPLVAAAAVGDAQVIDLALLGQSDSAAARDSSVIALSAPTSSSLPQIQPQPTPCFQPLIWRPHAFWPPAKCDPASQPAMSSNANERHQRVETVMGEYSRFENEHVNRN